MSSPDLKPHELMQRMADFFEAEDVLLNKLIYFKLSDRVSDKHLRDIAGMIKILGEKLDRQYIARWAKQLHVSEEWKLILSHLNN